MNYGITDQVKSKGYQYNLLQTWGYQILKYKYEIKNYKPFIQKVRGEGTMLADTRLSIKFIWQLILMTDNWEETNSSTVGVLG